MIYVRMRFVVENRVGGVHLHVGVNILDVLIESFILVIFFLG